MDGDANEPGVGEEASLPNVNCLEGKRCPMCGSMQPIEVVVSMRVLLYDNGTDDADDCSIEYDQDTPARCYVCRYEGKFGDFDVR